MYAKVWSGLQGGRKRWLRSPAQKIGCSMCGSCKDVRTDRFRADCTGAIDPLLPFSSIPNRRSDLVLASSDGPYHEPNPRIAFHEACLLLIGESCDGDVTQSL